MNLKKMTKKIQESGYDIADARARVCQDIILKAISRSVFSKNVTIKGGVVIRSMTGNIRRATQDMDIDFIRYSLSDESIDTFLKRINCLEGVDIVRVGKIEELSQQDYKGKRVFVRITDELGHSIDSKIDLGVHKHLEIEQEEYCFDVAFDDEGASLLINSREQMFAEKLRSLLKFGVHSTRYKDIYDMYYHCDKVDLNKLKYCLDTYIFNNSGMQENTMEDIIKRVEFVFQSTTYKRRVDSSDKRWIDDNIDDIFDKIVLFLRFMTEENCIEYDKLFKQRMLVAEKLKTCIRAMGYTKISFSRKADISISVLECMLNGTVHSKNDFRENLRKILDVLNLTAEELLSYRILLEHNDVEKIDCLNESKDYIMTERAETQYGLLEDVLDLCTIYY